VNIKQLCPFCGKPAHRHPIVMGGQGKSGREISDDTFWFVSFMALTIVLIILGACLFQSGFH